MGDSYSSCGWYSERVLPAGGALFLALFFILIIINIKKDEVLFYKNKTSSLVAAKPLIMILVRG
nr:MAG TPA: hypothetical protein [Caudoviricetes sp.]